VQIDRFSKIYPHPPAPSSAAKTHPVSAHTVTVTTAAVPEMSVRQQLAKHRAISVDVLKTFARHVRTGERQRASASGIAGAGSARTEG
jgi:hypothetical protein